MELAAAFFFDSRHEALAHVYGSTVKQAFFQALVDAGQADTARFHLHVGDLLTDSLTRRISGVQFGGPPKVGRTGVRSWESRSTWIDDSVARSALAAELLTTLSEGWHHWTTDRISRHLGTPLTYVTYVEPISVDTLAGVTDQLGAHQWFLGAAQIDVVNPLHAVLTTGKLVYLGFYRDRLFNFVQEPGSDPDERWDVTGEIGVGGIQCAWYQPDAEGALPNRLPRPNSASPAGLKTRRLMESVLEPSHHERVLRALDAGRFDDHDRVVTLDVVALEGADRAIVPREKLVDYALSKVHPVGRNKAHLFDKRLAITAKDWKFLANQLRVGLNVAEVSQVMDRSEYGTEHHIQYRADIPVVGRNGAIEVVRTVWKIVDAGAPSLITLFMTGDTGK